MATRKAMHERAEDVAVIRRVDSNNKRAARDAKLAALTKLRELKANGAPDMVVSRHYAAHEKEIHDGYELERQEAATAPAPKTQARRDASIFQNAAEREGRARAINKFNAYKALDGVNPVRAAAMLQRDPATISLGRRLANETPPDNDGGPKAA